ncbi:MAG: 50S ribosomal protein L9 [bacterium]
MKVIFLEDDRIEKVSEGYARNYLLPRKLAILATPKAEALVEKRKEKKQAEVEQKKAELNAVAEKLAAGELEILADAGEGGKLFGSITTADIVKAIKESLGLEIDKRKIIIIDSIKMVGEHKVKVKLFHDIFAPLLVKVTAR